LAADRGGPLIPSSEAIGWAVEVKHPEVPMEGANVVMFVVLDCCKEAGEVPAVTVDGPVTGHAGEPGEVSIKKWVLGDSALHRRME
jgi:hypothetical protein